MQQADIPFATRLTNVEGWGIPARDFKRILWLDRRGSFVAAEGGRRVGLATTTRYGRRIAWIGNVVVDRQYRQKHIGQRLVEQAVKYLTKARVACIALYCFDENTTFYRKLGFVKGPRFVRLRRGPKRGLPKPTINLPSKPLTLSSVLAIDRRGFGADRRRLITALLNESHASYLTYRAAHSASYVLVRNYDDMNEIGPWISFGLDSNELDSLLQLAITKSGPKPVEITSPLSNFYALKVIKRRGFHSINEGHVMFFKRIAKIGQPKAIVAHGFLDKG